MGRVWGGSGEGLGEKLHLRKQEKQQLGVRSISNSLGTILEGFRKPILLDREGQVALLIGPSGMRALRA